MCSRLPGRLLDCQKLLGTQYVCGVFITPERNQWFSISKPERPGDAAYGGVGELAPFARDAVRFALSQLEFVT